MQAIRHHPPGGTEKLKFGREDIPDIKDDEVLVKVHAASVIWMELYWDIYKKEDGWTQGTPHSGLTIGSEVMVFMSKAFPTDRSIDGGMAGYAKAHFSKMVRSPRSLSLTDAASVPLSALTAWQGLFDHAKLAAGQTLAKMVGARVIGTASSKQSFELLESFGVDKVLNYKEVELDSILENVDVVFDTVGGDTAKKARKALDLNKEPGPRVDFFIVDMNAEQLGKIGMTGDVPCGVTTIAYAQQQFTLMTATLGGLHHTLNTDCPNSTPSSGVCHINVTRGSGDESIPYAASRMASGSAYRRDSVAAHLARGCTTTEVDEYMSNPPINQSVNDTPEKGGRITQTQTELSRRLPRWNDT
ncbi:hypothetical protein ACCO45_007579 [Purpureocillium lilacinum]|uniref:Uncharacterized protein n=1 Tax=Purpureocillium lilacinum TaxID=33203 RepID=A0ACC4DKU2_PURLI